MTSGGNNFDEFPENQLAINTAFLCKPTWWTVTVSLFPLCPIIWGKGIYPENLGQRPLILLGRTLSDQRSCSVSVIKHCHVTEFCSMKFGHHVSSTTQALYQQQYKIHIFVSIILSSFHIHCYDFFSFSIAIVGASVINITYDSEDFPFAII